jgi:hypothetical protein
MRVVEEVLAAYERGWADALKSADLAPAGELVSREAMLGAVLKLVADSKDGYVNGLDVTNLITGLSGVARVPVVAKDQDSGLDA